MMKPIRTVAVLPTLFTLGNLVCGFFAIVVAANLERPTELVKLLSPEDIRHLWISGWLIFLAMVFDGLDGQVARLSKTTSDFGAQLDSLCDLVTFGVAPAFLVVKMCPRFEYMHRETVWIIATCYVACAAMRLARYNVETADESSDEGHLHFSGLPSPAAAATIAGFAIMLNTLRNTTLFDTTQAEQTLQVILPFIALGLALMMVSRIPYPHVMNQIFRGRHSFGHVVAIVFAAVAVAAIRGYSVPVICLAFSFSGPVVFAWRKLVRPRKEAGQRSS
ncbi:MAG: CDP-diacylglycerol--serine O-phosphatidyltransferase [Planctomycetia bacterium]|jgi:CDP-diacylglycerol--serine O-phosphatidyltransferase